MSQGSGTVEIRGELVRKRYAREELQAEHAKAQALWECARRHEFVAPRPLRVDEAASAIEYERIAGFSALTGPYVREMSTGDLHGRLAAILREVARVLAAIHQDLRLPVTRPWEAPPLLLQGLRRAGDRDGRSATVGPRAVLHGDFGFSNLAVLPSDGPRPRIAVIDPSPNGFTTLRVDLEGPVLVDLALFTSCVEGRIPLRQQPRIRWSALGGLREVFVAAYEGAAGTALDLEALGMLQYATAYAYFSRVYGAGLRREAALALLYNRLKGNRRWWEGRP
ncbi:MAG: hypothetical protein KC501_26055 [Myxococcales bacterium]|nr:hypothetical protein [Myxococcales bacterium]